MTAIFLYFKFIALSPLLHKTLNWSCIATSILAFARTTPVTILFNYFRIEYNPFRFYNIDIIISLTAFTLINWKVIKDLIISFSEINVKSLRLLACLIILNWILSILLIIRWINKSSPPIVNSPTKPSANSIGAVICREPP